VEETDDEFLDSASGIHGWRICLRPRERGEGEHDSDSGSATGGDLGGRLFDLEEGGGERNLLASGS
jgi:hypothetical protein